MKHVKIACVVLAAIVFLPLFLMALCVPGFRKWIDDLCHFDYEGSESFAHANR